MDVAQIALDQFPAIAMTPEGGRFEPARTVVVNGQVQVWHVPSGGSDPVIAFERQALSVEGNHIAGYSILTADGIVTSNNAGGCGCGSRLRSFDPYGGATRMIARG